VEYKKTKSAPAKKKKSKKIEAHTGGAHHPRPAHVGGAITKRDRRVVMDVERKVKFQDAPITPNISTFEENGYPIYGMNSGDRGYSAWLEPSPFGIPTDLSYRMLTPADILRPKFMKDEHVLQNLKAMTKSKRTQDHHPAVQQAIFHSLKQYPELLQHYIHS